MKYRRLRCDNKACSKLIRAAGPLFVNAGKYFCSKQCFIENEHIREAKVELQQTAALGVG